MGRGASSCLRTSSTQTRTISTTAVFTLEQGTDQMFGVYRELVCDEDNDGSWLVYTVEPETVGIDGEDKVSGSIRLRDKASVELVSSLFSMLADPGGFGPAPAQSPDEAAPSRLVLESV